MQTDSNHWYFRRKMTRMTSHNRVKQYSQINEEISEEKLSKENKRTSNSLEFTIMNSYNSLWPKALSFKKYQTTGKRNRT